jgi:hypothetical protein
MILDAANSIKFGSSNVEKAYFGNNLIFTKSFLGEFSNAFVAYSLRNLTTQTPNVIRVQKTGGAERDFTAAELTDGTLESWVGSGNDGYLIKWYDQSGNNNHATASTGGSSASAALHSKVVSSGTYLGKIDIEAGNGLELDTKVPAAPPISVFAVYAGQGNIAASFGSMFYPTIAGSKNNGAGAIKYFMSNGAQLFSSDDHPSSATTTATAWIFNGDNSRIIQSDGTTTSGPAGDGTTTSNTNAGIQYVFGDGGITTTFQDAFEIIIYTSDQFDHLRETDQIDQLRANQKAYYSIS